MSNEVIAEKKKFSFIMHLDLDMCIAFNHLLTSTPVKGRKEMRAHSTLFRELKKLQQIINPEDGTAKWTDGEVVFNDAEVVEYLRTILDNRIKAGIPGGVSLGYEAIVDFVSS